MKTSVSILLTSVFSLVFMAQNGNAQNCIYCNSNTIGDSSSAIGAENISTGIYSLASGFQNEASGDYSTAIGYQSIASGKYSLAGGEESIASKKWAFAFGQRAEADGFRSFAQGMDVKAMGGNSVVIGRYARTLTGSAMVIGYGSGPEYENQLKNSINNSLMIGFNSDTATLFVGPSDQTGFGNVGIGTSDPTTRLDVNGTFKVNDWSYFKTINLGGYDINEVDEIKGVDGIRFEGVASYPSQMILDENGRLGIGTLEPVARLQVNGNIFIEDSFSGLILKSPDGQCWKGTIDDNGSFAFESIDCNLITGENKSPVAQQQKVDIFPNPAGNKLYIQLPVDIRNARVAIYNEQGVLLQKRELHGGKNQVSLKKMPGGVLVVKVSNAQGELLSTEKVLHQ